MELLRGPMINFSYPAARKKRSNSRRRPHPNPKPVIERQNVHTLFSSQTDYSGHEDIKLCHLNVKLNCPELERSIHPSIDHVKLGENHIDMQREPLHESDRIGNEKKIRKVKLKLVGMARSHQTKSLSEIASGSGPTSVKSFDNFDAYADLQKQDYSKNGFSFVKESYPLPKKRAIDDEFDDEVDEEILYLKKLKASKAVSGVRYGQDESNRRSKGSTKLMDLVPNKSRDYGSPGLGKDGRKKGRMHEDYDYEMEPMENFVDPLNGSGQEMTMTTRKRALECPESGSLVSFPNGLPAAPSKKQKLSEVEQQLRKAEVAQRRRLQAEKAAKEAEAEAIRKILGQDSNRKKKEEKLKKQQEELAQEKTSKAAVLGPNTVRWIIGPYGTIVTFSDDIGLPKIFGSQPYRYPPPREKCVGPNCKNEYKYRDSKSKLPICSLHCYKAVQQNAELLPAC